MTSIWKVGALLLVAVVVLPTLSIAWSSGSLSAQGVANEPITVDYGTNTSVDNASAVEYSDSVTITFNGSTLEAGTDYVWNATSGEVDWKNTAATTDGDTAHIDYTYYYRTEATTLIGGVIRPFGRVLALLLVAAIVMGGYKFATAGGGAGGL